MDLSDAAEQLYAAPPADFVTTRTRLATAARKDGDPDLAEEIRGLRKPTTVAWLLNLVARTEPAVIADLSDLGERMRTAQAKGDGPALAEARPERHERIEALVAAARRFAEDRGRRFGPAARDQVADTAVAALADEASGRALASGQLLRALRYAGFGEVELDDAVATPLRLVPPAPAGGDEEELDEAAARRAGELEEARDRLRETERELSAAKLARSEAEQALEAASARVADLEQAVADAEAAVTHLSVEVPPLE